MNSKPAHINKAWLVYIGQNAELVAEPLVSFDQKRKGAVGLMAANEEEALTRGRRILAAKLELAALGKETRNG